MTGKRFGRLTAIKTAPRKKSNTTRWECKCDCGRIIQTTRTSLIRGKSKSCGCYAVEKSTGNKYRETHGQSYTRLYAIWQGMKQRCYDKNTEGYAIYGKKGIEICDEWLKFENFYKWAKGSGYSEDLTIDRIDNLKGYSPSNCRWATVKEQNRNKRKNRIIEKDGEAHCVGYWSEKLNIPMSTIINRLNRGCTAEEALNTNYKRRSRGVDVG